jgi:hypothetical protein
MTDPLTPAPLSEAERAGPEGRWRIYDCEELIYRDKASLDIFWLKDEPDYLQGSAMLSKR